MKQNGLTTWEKTTERMLIFLLIGVLGAGLFCGCASQKAWRGISPDAGPTVPKAGISAAASADRRNLIEQLYGDAPEAANAAVLLGRNKENEAIPFLVSMLGDIRLVELRDPLFEEYKPAYPVGYVAARSLGLFGENSVIPVINWLKGNHEYFYLRGNAAAALSFSLNDDRNTPGRFRKLNGTDQSMTVICALESCTGMGTNPMFLPAVARHPDYALSTGNRGGISTYIRVAGMMEDPRALPVLHKIINDSEFTDLEKSYAKEAVSLIGER